MCEIVPRKELRISHFRHQPVAVALSLGLFVSLGSGMVACQSSAHRAESSPTPPTTQVADEVSLKSDRSKYDELRKDEPEEVKRENDELALIREMMANADEEPGKIRDRFSKAMHDRRDKFDKIARHQRDDFNRREKKEREDFLKKIKDQRTEFQEKSKKATTEERKQFFSEQESQRSDFFADQNDHRKDFESTMNESRKTFEAYITERRNQFEHDMREYTTNYYDRRKNLDLKKRMDDKAKAHAKDAERAKADAAANGEGSARGEHAPADPVNDKDLDDFRAIPKTQALPLTPRDGQ